MSKLCQVGSGPRMLPVLLVLAALFQACGGEELRVTEGPAFAQAPDPVAGGARVYLYWPAEAAGPWEQVHLYAGSGIQVLRQGEYVEAVLGPGPSHFSASQNWTVSATTVAGLELGELRMVAEANRTHFVRVRPRPDTWTLDFELSPVEPEEALPEIQRCRRTVLEIQASGATAAGPAYSR